MPTPTWPGAPAHHLPQCTLYPPPPPPQTPPHTHTPVYGALRTHPPTHPLTPLFGSHAPCPLPLVRAPLFSPLPLLLPGTLGSYCDATDMLFSSLSTRGSRRRGGGGRAGEGARCTRSLPVGLGSWPLLHRPSQARRSRDACRASAAIVLHLPGGLEQLDNGAASLHRARSNSPVRVCAMV